MTIICLAADWAGLLSSTWNLTFTSLIDATCSIYCCIACFCMLSVVLNRLRNCTDSLCRSLIQLFQKVDYFSTQIYVLMRCWPAVLHMVKMMVECMWRPYFFVPCWQIWFIGSWDYLTGILSPPPCMSVPYRLQILKRFLWCGNAVFTAQILVMKSELDWAFLLKAVAPSKCLRCSCTHASLLSSFPRERRLNFEYMFRYCMLKRLYSVNSKYLCHAMCLCRWILTIGIVKDQLVFEVGTGGTPCKAETFNLGHPWGSYS